MEINFIFFQGKGGGLLLAEQENEARHSIK